MKFEIVGKLTFPANAKLSKLCSDGFLFHYTPECVRACVGSCACFCVCACAEMRTVLVCVLASACLTVLCSSNDIGSWQGFMSPRLHSEGLGSLPRLGCWGWGWGGRATESANRRPEKAGKWGCSEKPGRRQSDGEGMKEGDNRDEHSQKLTCKGKGEALGQNQLDTKGSEVGGAQIEDKLWLGWVQSFVV